MEFEPWTGAGPIGPLFNLSTVENPFQAPSSYGAAFDETAPPGGTYGFAGNNAAQSPAVVHIHKIKIKDAAIREGCPVAFPINADLSAANPELTRLTLYPEKIKNAFGTLVDNPSLVGKETYKCAMRLRNDPAEMDGDGDIALMAQNLEAGYSAGVLMSKEHISGDMYRVVIAIEHFVSVHPEFIDGSFKQKGSSCVCVLAV